MTPRILALGASLVALMVLSGAAAQDTTPTPELGQAFFQTITVGQISYTVDSFYAVACFPNHMEQSLSADGVTGLATLQCFFRDSKGAMVPQPVFDTTMEGAMAKVELGDAIYGYPQVELKQQ
jgi:hypothetical protein